MVGAGATVFAVMGYIIANQEPDSHVGAQVRLNPKLLSAIFGETEQAVSDAIAYLCKPDPESNSPEKDGRRLIKIGQFDYQVVNGAKYRNIRNQEERRLQNATNVQRFRMRKHLPLKGEQEYAKAVADGEPTETLDGIIEKYLKKPARSSATAVQEEPHLEPLPIGAIGNSG